jgi:hypothetical protein
MKNKKVLVVITVIVLLIVGALLIVLTSLNHIVAAAIERYGSMITQTKVTVSSVNIKLRAGEGSVSGLKIGNPSGFSGSSLFQLGNISTKIDTGSITKDTIVIDHVIISAPRVSYEINKSGTANINVIKQNVQQFQGQSASGKDKEQNKGREKSVKLLIRKLLIENGEVDVRVAALPDKSLSAPLPRIELSNLGGKGGSSPGEVGAQILSALTKEAGSAASRVGIEKYLGKSAEQVRDELQKGMTKGSEALKETAKGAGEAVKKLFGQ